MLYDINSVFSININRLSTVYLLLIPLVVKLFLHPMALQDFLHGLGVVPAHLLV